MLFSVSLRAADINDDGAADLKTLFETLIEDRAERAQEKELTLKYEGDINVEPADTHYAVTLPNTSVIHKNGQRTEIGMLAINAIPHDDPELWKMAVAIPTPIIRFDKNDKLFSKLDIGAQKAAGLWNTESGHFTQLDARYENVSFNIPRKSFSLKVPSVSVLYNFIENEDGALTGPAEITIQNAEMQNEYAGTSSAENIRLNLELYEYNPAPLPEAAAPSDMIFHLLSRAGRGFVIVYDITNAKLVQPPHTDGEDSEPDIFTFDKGNLAIKAENLNTDKAALGLRLNYRGLKPTTPMPVTTPRDVNIDIALNDLPFSQLLTLSENTLKSMADTTALNKMAGIGFMMKLPVLLSAAGTNMEIKDSHITHDSYSIRMSGKAVADMTAVNSATGSARIEVRGMDWLAEHITEDEMLAGIAKTLVKYREAARMEPDPDGTPVHIYELEMNAQGQILLNGKNLFGILMQESSPPAAPAEDMAE